MEYLFIYLLHLAKIISFITILSFILSLISGLFYAIFNFDTCQDEFLSDEYQKVASKIRPYFIVFTITAILFSLFPTKDILLLMGGTYFGKKAVNQVITSERLKKVNTIIDLKLDEYIKNHNQK